MAFTEWDESGTPPGLQRDLSNKGLSIVTLSLGFEFAIDIHSSCYWYS